MNEPVTPRVSILMPAYNHEKFVEQAVRSVWDQTVKDIELIVVDDGSKDSTPAILQELAASSPVPMTVSVQPNAGISATLNRAFSQARGEWIAILASDDFYGPDFIKRNLEVADGHAQGDVTQHSDAFLVEHDGRITGTLDEISPRTPLQGDAFDLLATGGGRLLPISMFARKDLLQSVGFCDPSLVNEDYDLHLRLARASRFEYINEPLVYSRHTPGSLGKQPWLFGDSVIVALEKHRDRLGDRLPEILRNRALIIASTCFEYGRPGHGLKWGARTVRYSTSGQKVRSAFDVAKAATIGLSRYGARALVGRERLVRLKRRITQP
jgi:alpha-1,3-rhamnosyltransferase